MDYFFLFYAILGTSICLSLTVFTVVVILTSREPHPPLPKRSPKPQSSLDSQDESAVAGKAVDEVRHRLAA